MLLLGTVGGWVDVANLGTNYEIPDNDKIGFGCGLTGLVTDECRPGAGEGGINLQALCHLTNICFFSFIKV